MEHSAKYRVHLRLGLLHAAFLSLLQPCPENPTLAFKRNQDQTKTQGEIQNHKFSAASGV